MHSAITKMFFDDLQKESTLSFDLEATCHCSQRITLLSFAGIRALLPYSFLSKCFWSNHPIGLYFLLKSLHTSQFATLVSGPLLFTWQLIPSVSLISISKSRPTPASPLWRVSHCHISRRSFESFHGDIQYRWHHPHPPCSFMYWKIFFKLLRRVLFGRIVNPSSYLFLKQSFWHAVSH